MNNLTNVILTKNLGRGRKKVYYINDVIYSECDKTLLTIYWNGEHIKYEVLDKGNNVIDKGMEKYNDTKFVFSRKDIIHMTQGRYNGRLY